MQTEVVISGFGGQGALFAGQILAYAGMDYGKEVTWIPSYGPEMRGGTANCTVIISDEEIGSPLVLKPTTVIAMNLPSLDKYEPAVAKGGTFVVNASLTNREVKRDDIDVVMIPANEIAEALGNRRLMNIVLLGALLAKRPFLPIEAVEAAFKNHLPERHRHLLEVNLEALKKGVEFVNGEVEKTV